MAVADGLLDQADHPRQPGDRPVGFELPRDDGSLELDATQVELFVRQLGDFLAYAHDVLAVNTEGVAPTASMVTRHEADRPDQVQPCLERAAALSNAPEPAMEAGFFKVPRVIG